MIHDDDAEIEAMLSRAETTEAHARGVAMQHIQAYAPFYDLPDYEQDREIRDFEALAKTGVVRKVEMSGLLARDIDSYMIKLRPQTLQYPQINSVRLAVLAHVAMVIGADSLAKARELWAAISQSLWDDAQDALLMTKWPEHARTESDRRRVLELARMMRTGVVPLHWTTQVN